MGELKLKREMTIKEASAVFNKSRSFFARNIRAGVIPVVHFNGRPIKPYKVIYEDLEMLFTVASRSLKTRDVEKALGRKPLKKEEFIWPE